MGVNAHSKGKISNDPEIYIIKNIYYIYHKYDTQQLYWNCSSAYMTNNQVTAIKNYYLKTITCPKENCWAKREAWKTNKKNTFPLSSKENQLCLHAFLLIALNLSLKQRAMEFALKYEAKCPGHAHNRRQLHLFAEQGTKKKSAFLFAAVCHCCKDTEGSGTEQGNRKESTAVIKMSNECALAGKRRATTHSPENPVLNSTKSSECLKHDSS